MRIEILIIVFLVAFGIAFMNYKNKQKAKEIRLKMKNRVSETKKRENTNHNTV